MPADRAVGGIIRPVDVLFVDGYSFRVNPARDKALVHARAVKIGLPDRTVGEVRPEDVVTTDGNGVRTVCSRDKALVDTRSVEIRPCDRIGACIRPIHKRAGLRSQQSERRYRQQSRHSQRDRDSPKRADRSPRTESHQHDCPLSSPRWDGNPDPAYQNSLTYGQEAKEIVRGARAGNDPPPERTPFSVA